MSRHIDADKLKSDIKEIAKITGGNLTEFEVLGILSGQPIADLVEVEKVNKIYEKLADLFDTPCNYSPCDEIMLESERCKEDCGNISEAECWKRYFEVVCDGERADI